MEDGWSTVEDAILVAFAALQGSKVDIKNPEAYLVGILGKKLKGPQAWAKP